MVVSLLGDRNLDLDFTFSGCIKRQNLVVTKSEKKELNQDDPGCVSFCSVTFSHFTALLSNGP